MFYLYQNVIEFFFEIINYNRINNTTIIKKNNYKIIKNIS